MVSPIAETTTTTSLALLARADDAVGDRVGCGRSSPTEVPPYFCTTMGMGWRVAVGLGAAWERVGWFGGGSGALGGGEAAARAERRPLARAVASGFCLSEP